MKRPLSSDKVILNVYDLHPANEFLYQAGFGVHHSGVQVGNTEYTFGGGGGVVSHPPREAPGVPFREAIELGEYRGGLSGLESVLDNLRSEFKGDDYNLVLRNCNHFADALVYQLLHRYIPGHVNRLADFGGMISCCLPQALTQQQSPVAAQASGGSSSRHTTTPFAGSGYQLSADSDVPSGLNDRRERIRAANINRLS